MNKNKYLTLVPLLSFPISVLASPSYNFVDIDKLGFGNINIVAINDNNEMLGYDAMVGIDKSVGIWSETKQIYLNNSGEMGGASDINNNSQATVQNMQTFYGSILENGKLTDIGSFRDISGATDINNLGVAVGLSRTTPLHPSQTHAVKWDGTELKDLGTLYGGFTSEALAINDNGQIVGISKNGNNFQTDPVIWNNDKISQLPELSDSSSARPVDINNHGQIVGITYGNTTMERATLWENGSVFNLGTLGGDYSVANAINNLGVIVGSSRVSSDYTISTHAFLWHDNTMIDLNSLIDPALAKAGWVLMDAKDINDNGWVIGVAENTITHEYTDYLLKPVSPIPEPATWSLLLAGLGILGYRIKNS